jgi:transposase
MPEKRRWFDREFREGAVRIIRETNKPIAQVADDLVSIRARWGTGSSGTRSSAARSRA